MERNHKRTLGQRWEELQPTKAILGWACIATAVATIAIGFTFGGWVTGGTAQQMGDEARAELAAIVCVDRFLAGGDANAQLAELKDFRSSYQQRQFVEAGGWATMPNMESATRQAASLCAQTLAALEMESTASAASAETVSE